ncbi:hypothetical protein [Methylobacterium soli]|uniref:Uncharacterized protein n=1 Tax=Methylobacterium soli TaxID=553447 RepID=A0A6L3SSK3_9HYPH|nr:hypothetical protein [Methylobacterium soli]KAB1070181.1 hypothetical protein F6X53_30405 [Methylobacterium soli]
MKATDMERPQCTAEIATDSLLKAIVKGEQRGLTFSAVRDGGALTTWREPGMAQLGPAIGFCVADPSGAAQWTELHRLGEIIQAAGGLDALDEANMHLVQMDPEHSDWRAMVLESVWYDIGRVE